ncbi:MAG TPA: type II secretion system F family protein [Longimicrobiales bacterium]|nr:type II secretion system F family protein [Longimicrobiales bacterium]
MTATWVTGILMFLATAMGFLSLALMWEIIQDWLRERRVGKRIEEMVVAQDNPELLARQRDLLRPSTEAGESDPWGFELPGSDSLNRLLTQARLQWRPESFLLMTFGMTFGMGGAVLIVTGSYFFSFVAGLAGASWPYMYARRRRKKRFLDFEEQFPEAIDLLTRAIRAGHPLASGIRMVADEGPPEVAREFRQTFEEQRFGLPFEEALLGMVDRTNMLDVRMFAIAVLVQREVGGNLAEILDNLAETIRGRFYIRRQLRIYTAQGRMSGYALTALPVVVGFVLYLMQPDYVGMLFSTMIGWFMVLSALFMQVVGGLWIRNIINIDI